MNDFNEIRTMGKKLVHSRSAFFNLLRDPDLSNRKIKKLRKPVSQLRDILQIVRSHHERMDGRDYPDGLSDGEIPLLARIITVADSFDSMMSDRPYRHQQRMEDALLELQRCSGAQFAPEIIDVFLRSIKNLMP